MASHATNDFISLDGRRFAMVSSTNSRVDPERPTEFLYHQKGKLVWGEYFGDTVTQGRFVGSFDGQTLSISFAHELVSTLEVITGSADSRVEERDGLTHLIEEFLIDGVNHESVCVEI